MSDHRRRVGSLLSAESRELVWDHIWPEIALGTGRSPKTLAESRFAYDPDLRGRRFLGLAYTSVVPARSLYALADELACERTEFRTAATQLPAYLGPSPALQELADIVASASGLHLPDNIAAKVRLQRASGLSPVCALDAYRLHRVQIILAVIEDVATDLHKAGAGFSKGAKLSSLVTALSVLGAACNGDMLTSQALKRALADYLHIHYVSIDRVLRSIGSQVAAEPLLATVARQVLDRLHDQDIHLELPQSAA